MMAEYYDFIRIYGTPENPAEEFQGLGAAGTYNAPESQPISGEAESGSTETAVDRSGVSISDDLWRSQSSLIEQQNAYLDDIKATFAEKREDLNVGFSIREFTQSNAFKYLADIAVKKVTDWITDAWPGLADDAVLDTIAKYAPRAIGWGVVWLHKQFLAGGILCERMKEENLQLLPLAKSFDGYRLRSDILTQHDLTIQSLLSQVALVETQISQNDDALAQIFSESMFATYDPKLGWKRKIGLAEHLNKALFVKDKEGLNEDIGIATILQQMLNTDHAEAVIKCPHTGDFIFTQSRGKMSKV